MKKLKQIEIIDKKRIEKYAKISMNSKQRNQLRGKLEKSNRSLRRVIALVEEQLKKYIKNF